MEASQTGAGTNILAGVSVGLSSTLIPGLTLCAMVLLSYGCGQLSGLHDTDGNRLGGIFGIAITAMTLQSSSLFALALHAFCPITDNAAGIVDMSQQAEDVRYITDKLNAVGNNTKSLTKGFSLASAALTALLVIASFFQYISIYLGVYVLI